MELRLSKRQKEIVDAMKAGAILWHPYNRSSSKVAYLTGSIAKFHVKYSTIDKLCDIGAIEEIEDWSSDVKYRVKSFL